MNKNRYSSLVLLGLSLFATSENIQAQAPGGVRTDNTVWLKANAGTTLNATNNVTTWAEQSGAAITGDFSTHNPGASGTTQNPPLLVQGAINFNPNLKFVYTAPNCISSNNLISGTQIIGAQEMTMFQVINLHAIPPGKPAAVWCKWQTINTSPARLGDETNTGTGLGKIRLDFRNSGNPLVSNAVVTDLQKLYTSTATATNLSMRLDGSGDNSMTISGTFSPSGTARLSLGNENEAGFDAYPTSIDIAEFILYKRSLTAIERNKIESYLAVKYGFTLAQTGTDANDYIATDATVIWDHVANAPYLNNITGVGRDDSSALDQRQSLSIHPGAMVTMYNGNIPGTFPAINTANTNAFAGNRSFLLFGDNHADTLVTLCSTDGKYARMRRVWKVQTTNTPGPVTLTLKKANVPPQITQLIIANDPGFTTGLTFVPIQDNGTELYASANFTNNQPYYFTFGTTPMALNGVVGPVVCQGNNGSVTLSPTGGTTPISYSWSSTPPQTSQDLNGVAPGTYTVTVTQGNGCTFSENYTITGNASPVFLKVKDTANTLCTSSNGLIEVNGVGGTPTYQYSIDGGTFGGSPRFNNLAPGPHTITIKDQNNCESDTTITLTNTSYKLTAEGEGENAWCDAGGLGGKVSIEAGGGASPYSYFWDNLPNGKGPVMSNLPKGTYKVIVTDYYGCTGETSVSIDEESCCKIGIPNAFSPNADGTNDKFVAVSNRPIPKYEMAIFNRWGQRVFYTTKFDEGWDGSHYNGGNMLDAGTYFYRIRYTCEMGNREFTYQGDLTLIR
ncbi:T9SS type B sorting domain-containing protein [Taibaiella koreensis]|uniref:T9SS type B sorting domain-containing protein n=1 Tax=Taibaiella koreensis TaxID=1268548 RepID=UPI000E59FAF4|nr:gliding motility-associated C-terminal domain-containing protein [Taibaiella koreensis]